MLMQEQLSTLVHLQVCGTDSMSGMQAWRYLQAALAFGKQLKVWSLQNHALQCESSFHQTRFCLICLL